MKKVWVLEKLLNRDEITATINTLRNMIVDTNDDEFTKIAEEAISNYESKLDSGMWSPRVERSRYSEFCSDAKRVIRLADEKAISDLKASLGNVKYDDEVKAMYRDAHKSVKDMFRVVEVEMDAKGKYNIINVNDGVYRYLWVR